MINMGNKNNQLTLAPLPDWSVLFRSFVRCLPTDSDLAQHWCREGDVAGWLSRSAWSLALIALWRKRCFSDSAVTVWIPDYFCNASLTALRQAGVKLVFYPVTDKMSPDIAACKLLESSDPPSIFVLAHYFGQPNSTRETRDLCARHGSWLVEDAAHVLRPVDGIGTNGDFVLYSPHKHLPVPNGAVLLIRPNGPCRLGKSSLELFGSPIGWPEQLSVLQKVVCGTKISIRAHGTVWLVKRVLQKMGISSWRFSTLAFTESLVTDNTTSTKLPHPQMCNLARRLLAGLCPNIGTIARQRQRHQLLWDGLLVDDEKILATERPKLREWTPYISAYKTTPDIAKKVYDQWSRSGLPVMTWPDLPPEVVNNREGYSNAWQLRHKYIYLPVHQSLNMPKLVKRRQLPSCNDNLNISLKWNCATQEQWQQWMIQIGRSNLLQSWSYGEAKAEESSWQVVRGVFYCKGNPVAIVQMLQKRVAGLFCVMRINRGPLFLKTVTPQELLDIWAKLLSFGNFRRGRILTIAPEVDLSRSSMIMAAKMGLRFFSPQMWESVWLDLEPELDQLRKRLDGKWRNMLAFAEKSGLNLEVGSDERLFDWMMEKYQRLMQEKEFYGAPVSFLKSLQRHSSNEQPLIILRVVHEGEFIAGICLACHGATATYLVGWNGNQGRKLKANQYLLWNAIAYLKQRGFRWFDLGGINEERTPSITTFKLGLCGERYELMGEYWKW